MTLKIAVVEPIPSPRAAMHARTNPRSLRRLRIPKRRSCQSKFISGASSKYPPKIDRRIHGSRTRLRRTVRTDPGTVASRNRTGIPRSAFDAGIWPVFPARFGLGPEGLFMFRSNRLADGMDDVRLRSLCEVAAKEPRARQPRHTSGAYRGGY